MYDQLNMLVLDEPTNHLDVASREWIECAVEEYEGTLLFVSHDRYFIDRFATRIWELEDGKIRDFPCGYAKYRSIKEHEKAGAAAAPVVTKEKKEKPKQNDQALEKLVRKLEREIAQMEAASADLDTQIEAAGADYQKLNDLMQEKTAQEEQLLVLMEQWEEASMALESS